MVKQELQKRNRHPDWVINMDQTPIWYVMAPKTIIKILGAKQAGIKTPVVVSKCTTIATTVTASRKMLWEVVIFKGKPNGTNSKKEFRHYKDWHGCTGIYSCQESAWMDKEVMNLWV